MDLLSPIPGPLIHSSVLSAFHPTLAPCGGNITLDNGTIFSPRYPEEYPNSADCSWLITVAPGFGISVNFTLLQVHGPHDFITVWWGPAISASCILLNHKYYICYSVHPKHECYILSIFCWSDIDYDFQNLMSGEAENVCILLIWIPRMLPQQLIWTVGPRRQHGSWYQDMDPVGREGTWTPLWYWELGFCSDTFFWILLV